MSSERVLSLYKKLLGLAEDQLNALRDERFDEALEILEKRQRIIDDIQNIDREVMNTQLLPLNEEAHNHRNNGSREMVINIEKILTRNNEMKNTLQLEMASLLDQISVLENFKLFSRHNKCNQNGSTISISI